MKYNPHDYQKYAIDFIEKNPQAAVLLECGLGKTSITLTALNDMMFDRFEVRKVLIIAPIRVCKNSWAAEIGKWDHLKGLTYSLVLGNREQRLAALRKKADLYIINRENVQWLIEETGMPFDFDMVVIDELSSFKNHQSKRFKALRKVRPFVKRIVGLTGTPCSNGLMDLWAQFRLLDKGERLGKRIGQYRDAYFTPDWNGFTYSPRPGAEKEIYGKIADISISMKTTDHLKMPELVSVSDPVIMSEAEIKAYRKLEKEYTLPLLHDDVTAANAAVLCGKLVQLASGCVYDDGGTPTIIHNRKLDALEDLLEAQNGKPVLVAYWYQHERERIKARFDVREIKTDQDIADWNDGKIPVALIQPSSAGHGLNLQDGGSTIIWFTMPWSLELYQQTNARLWRQGQNADTVVIHHLVATGTIDEDIMDALESKDKTQSTMMSAVKARLRE
ncbi:SNF2-related protein [Ruminococcus flavefaciens]|uniref:SNF2-related protein n=1 Tax=Ruminococcus flavefaciens TaxID=1265 RepID=UPI0004910627|nr:SNF2-related protein [Ruminococcus flavefaciens]